jgi:heme/copper-type cytochrome/quinol oxidase subunit 3
VTTTTADPIPFAQPVPTLGYLSPQDALKRPRLMSVVAILNIIIGSLGVLIYLVIAAFSWMANSHLMANSPSQIDSLYSFEFYACWAATLWLLAAGIHVFIWKGNSKFNPRRTLLVYVIAKLALGILYAILNIIFYQNLFAGPFPNRIWLSEIFFWLMLMCDYPLFLLGVFYYRPVRQYY